MDEPSLVEKWPFQGSGLALSRRENELSETWTSPLSSRDGCSSPAGSEPGGCRGGGGRGALGLGFLGGRPGRDENRSSVGQVLRPAPLLSIRRKGQRQLRERMPPARYARERRRNPVALEMRIGLWRARITRSLSRTPFKRSPTVSLRPRTQGAHELRRALRRRSAFASSATYQATRATRAARADASEARAQKRAPTQGPFPSGRAHPRRWAAVLVSDAKGSRSRPGRIHNASIVLQPTVFQ